MPCISIANLCLFWYIQLFRSATKANLVTRGTGCKGAYSLMNLPNHDPILQCIPDAMHTVKDAVVNIYDVMIGKDDTINCRKCELNCGRCFGIMPESVHQKFSRKNPGVPYSLSSSDIKLADKRAETIITPVHIEFVPNAIFTKTANLKSHDWKQVSICSYSCCVVAMYITYTCLCIIMYMNYFVAGHSWNLEILHTWFARQESKNVYFKIFQCMF